MIVHYFGAKWCGPCKQAKPFIQARADELRGTSHEFVFWDIDDDESHDMCERYNVTAVPTVIVLNNEGEVHIAFKGWNADSRGIFDETVDSLTKED